jgi:hypothetical protein
MVSVALDSSAVTPAQIEYLPRDSSANPAVIELARLVRVQVFCEMLKTSVVSTDWLGEMMVFNPDAESLGVPAVVAMRMPLPPGHPPTGLGALESVRAACWIGVCP